MTAAERQALIARYADGVRQFEEALATVPAEAMQWRPAPNKWSAHEVAVHCADSETNGAMRIRFLVGESKPTLLGYDQDAWTRTFDYHNYPLDVARAQVQAVRRYTHEMIRRLPESAWSREGTHTEVGRYTAEDWLRIYAEHLEVHASQIRRNVDAWRAVR